MNDLRILYEKCGDIRYISHLDMNRCMQRALARSGLPVWRTLGFNPHMYLTFALPLSLGFESGYEIMDIRLRESLEEAEILTRLNAQMPLGLRVLRALPPEQSIQEIAASVYQISLGTQGNAERACHELSDFFSQSIVVQKKTKRGTFVNLDIHPFVQCSDLRALDETAVCFLLRCVSGTQLNVNPTLAMQAFCALYGYNPLDVSYRRMTILNEVDEPFR